MALHRGFDDLDPVRPERIGRHEHDQTDRSHRLATGTLACPRCDAPVHAAGVLAPADALGCPYCRHQAPLRDFLSLSAPSRPARVEVRVVLPASG